MGQVVLFGVPIPLWAYAAVWFVSWAAVLLFAKKLVFRWLVQFAGKTAGRLDDSLLESLDFPLNIFILSTGVGVCRAMLPLDGTQEFRSLTLGIFKLGVALSLLLFCDRLLRALLRVYGSRIDLVRTSGGFIQGIIRLIFLGAGLLIMLDALGISITPIWASLGIGSLGVALGLQPTLENLFAGVQIVSDRMVQVGHFVRLDSGEEGYVDKIGWRSTWIRMLTNNTVIVPNKILVNQRVLNYHYPQIEMAALVQVGVSYDSDLERVEKITVEVASDVLKSVPGGVPDFKPLIRYHTFNQSSIDFTVVLRIREFTDQYLLKHEFIKHLHARYKQEGIVIPYPIRTLDIKPELAEALKKSRA